MQIKVRGYLTFRDVIGNQTIETGGDQRILLQDLLQNLARDLDEEFKSMVNDLSDESVKERIAVLVNGQHYSHLKEGLKTKLKEGDEIAIFPPMAGG
jgi:molybdopterin synthase sulfur carrier subunit